MKVTTKVAVENVEIGVADKDQATAARTTRLVVYHVNISLYVFFFHIFGYYFLVANF